MQPTDSSHQPASKKGNIIISFNDDDTCNSVRQYLESAGYGVYVCCSLTDFMEVEHQHLICTIIDISTDNPDKFHSIEIIKQSPVGVHVPMLVVAEVSSTDNIIRALNAGANDYLLRPFSRKELLQRITTLTMAH